MEMHHKSVPAATRVGSPDEQETLFAAWSAHRLCHEILGEHSCACASVRHWAGWGGDEAGLICSGRSVTHIGVQQTCALNSSILRDRIVNSLVISCWMAESPQQYPLPPACRTVGTPVQGGISKYRSTFLLGIEVMD